MDLLIFVVVCGLRLGVPLLILRYPLPAILFALVIDAADQTIFQAWTDLDLTSYQSYDKALDVYYLAIAYIATFRNWRNGMAILVAAALWYYRLVGVVLFELTEWRPLLLIFPNTFEYYFIALAVVRLGWDETRLTGRQVLTIAGAIWVFVKLPQEWWIHIAQLDFTDFMKADVLGVEATDSWGTALGNRPLVSAAIVVVVVGIAALAVALWRRTPPQDHPVTFDADAVFGFDRRSPPSDPVRPWREGLVEKIVLIALMAIIFGRVIPGSTATVLEVFVGVSVLVASNAAATQRLQRRGHSWESVGRSFLGNLLVNVGLLLAFGNLLSSDDDGSSVLGLAFFLFLLTLVIALFDRYRPTREPLVWELGPPQTAAHR
ncbi:MAG: hypothetical protein AAGA99_09185 [Actinomycetota bacterium]